MATLSKTPKVEDSPVIAWVVRIFTGAVTAAAEPVAWGGNRFTGLTWSSCFWVTPEGEAQTRRPPARLQLRVARSRLAPRRDRSPGHGGAESLARRRSGPRDGRVLGAVPDNNNRWAGQPASGEDRARGPHGGAPTTCATSAQALSVVARHHWPRPTPPGHHCRVGPPERTGVWGPYGQPPTHGAHFVSPLHECGPQI